MGKKNKKTRINVVFSTDPDYDYQYEEKEESETLPPSQQKLRVSLDRKQRKGKEVTLITGFKGREDDCKELGKWLKKSCGVGGSVKEAEIIVQGDQRKKVIDLLLKEGYSQTKQSGG
jgi:translation initiation factor 1